MGLIKSKTVVSKQVMQDEKPKEINPRATLSKILYQPINKKRRHTAVKRCSFRNSLMAVPDMTRKLDSNSKKVMNM